MIADLILSKLDKVRKTGRDTWSACCPAHGDRTPSLSIRETDDKVLINCRAGCSAPEIVASVGLDLSDLFPPRQHHGKPMRNPFPAMQGLESLHLEALVVLTVAKAITKHEPVTEQDYQRLLLAVERISTVHGAVKPQIRGRQWD
jgi:hypothetical protein